ncbi:Multidrug resistance protein MdtC [bioreactor metagenome]|uniref:Multidrug resistance protein MdtC n=1 Tax=bioreactor metagenome TaxID=1076179 RepID=A0A644Z1J3_9ZZZZ
MRFNELVTGVRSDIAVKIFGEDLDYLALKAAEIAAQARTVEGAADVIVEKTVGLPQMRVTYNREKLAYYGVSIESLNQYLSMAFGGQISGTVFERERSFDLVVRFLEDFRQDIDNIRQMYVNLPDGNQVRLSELAQIEYSSGPAKISRDDTRRRVVVSVNVRNRDLQSVVRDIQQKVQENVVLQSGYSIDYGGQYQNLKNATTRLMIIVPIALVLIFLLLNFAFNSLKETIIIFSAIPLSIVGGVLLLWIRGMPFSISAGVGFIALFGVAVLNGIVLIEHFKELRHKNGGVKMHDIIVQGSVDRLRPVVLTAASAAMGFLPMAISTSAGAEVQRPLATVVIGGLATSTFLTMIVLPLLYGYFMSDERCKKKSRSRKKVTPKVKFWFVPILMVVSAAAFSQTRELSLEDAIAVGIANNRQLKTHELQIGRSKALLPTAFNIGKTNVYYGTDANNIAENNHPLYVVGASQQMDFPTVYAARHKANRAEVSVSQAVYELELQRLRKNITQAYYHVVYLQNKQQHYDYIAGIYRKFSQSAAAQYKQGEIAYLEKLNATAKQQQIEVQQKQAASDLQIAYRQLNLLLQPDENISVPFQQLEPVLLSENIRTNAGLKLSDEQLRYENALLGVEKNLWLPNINVEVFNGTNRFANAKSYWGWQVGVSIPLFFGEQKARVASQKYSVMMADYSRQQYQIRYNSTNEQLRNELEKYRQNIDYYQTSGKQISDELIKFATSGYEVGEIDFFRYIQSLENAVQLRMDYLDNLAKYNETAIALNYLMME